MRIRESGHPGHVLLWRSNNSNLCDSCNKPLKAGDVAYLMEFFTRESPKVSDYWVNYFDSGKEISGVRTSKRGPRTVFSVEYLNFFEYPIDDIVGGLDCFVVEHVEDDHYLIGTGVGFVLLEALAQTDSDAEDDVVILAPEARREVFDDLVHETLPHNGLSRMIPAVMAAADRVDSYFAD